MQDKKISQVKGFSLVEVSIVIIVISLIMAGMLSIFAEGFYSIKHAKERTAAYSLARAKLEKYSNWTVVSGAPSFFTDTASINNITYTVNVTISDYISSQPDIYFPPWFILIFPGSSQSIDFQIKRINVTVKWAGEDFNISTLRSNR